VWLVLVVSNGLEISREPPPGLAEPDSWSETFQDFLTQCLQKVRRHGSCLIWLYDVDYVSAAQPHCLQDFFA
jgi:hypothetical protein